MTARPTAIPTTVMLVNNDLTASVRDQIIRQLYIDEVLDGYIFDNRVAADPGYVDSVHRENLRLMVLRRFDDFTNRELFDLVGWVAHGNIAIEKNLFGPPILTLPLARLTYHSLGRF